MKVMMLDGKIIDCKIEKVPAALHRRYGFEKMAHWNDKDTGGKCSVPVTPGLYGISGDVKYQEAIQVNPSGESPAT
jgi:hypothetical protein